MAIKKAYQGIVAFLEENSGKKVSTILDEVIEMASAKSRAGGATGGKSFLKDVEGTVVMIFDYYFKRWMPLVGEKAVEYGSKQNSATGYNTMCKEGVSHWTKQQRISKTATASLINRLESGDLLPGDIGEEKLRIEADRAVIVDTDLGFADQADAMAYLADAGFEMPAAE